VSFDRLRRAFAARLTSTRHVSQLWRQMRVTIEYCTL